MNTMLRAASVAALLGLLPGMAAAQPFEAVGTRAAGMSGAFVAVADDASAVYWNPGALALGSYFSLTVDRTSAEVTPQDDGSGGRRSSWMLALAMPALGLSYYRLDVSSLAPISTALRPAALSPVRLDRLVTHHAGATLVQSIVDGVAVGATLKLVRGMASSTVHSGDDPEGLLEAGAGRAGRGTTRFDADIGVIAGHGPIKVGLTVRNLTEPSFEATGDGGPLRLERQARAGVAIMPRPGWIVAADADLLRTAGVLGSVRDVALGVEGKVARRAYVRGGLRMDTDGAGQHPSGSLGASYAATPSLLLDAQMTGGSGRAWRGWGVSGRFVY